MLEEISLGPTPADETCVPAPYSTAEIATNAREECQRYKKHLEAIFPDMPANVSLKVELCPYNFSRPAAVSGYYDVVIKYYDYDEEACDYAYFIEANLPSNWADKEIRKQETYIPCPECDGTKMVWVTSPTYRRRESCGYCGGTGIHPEATEETY